MKNIFAIIILGIILVPQISLASIESGFFDDEPECTDYCALACVQNLEVEAVFQEDCVSFCSESQCENDAYGDSSYQAVDDYITNSFLNLQETMMEEQGIPTGNSSVGSGDTATAQLENPIQASTVPEIVVNVIQVLLTLLGSAALLVFIYGGIMMITSAGNEERLKKARSTLIWAIAGLVIILVSYSLMSFIFARLGSA